MIIRGDHQDRDGPFAGSFDNFAFYRTSISIDNDGPLVRFDYASPHFLVKYRTIIYGI
ncbi:hypothetical protein NNL21_06335 [Paenibacillus mendelii]|nr:hypothetical protein [Paenibacillus mendelii]